MPSPSWLEISLTRLDANVACFASILSGEGSPAVHAAPGPEGAPGSAATRSTAPASKPGATPPPATRLAPTRAGDRLALPAKASQTPRTPVVPRRTTPLLCGVVKADAYGLGAATIAPRLVARGVDMLAVYSPAQAEQLAALSLGCPVLVLMRMTELGRGDPLYRHALTGRLHLTLHDREQMQELEHNARMLGCQVPVHLYVDTGMSRAGMSPEQAAAALAELATLRHLRLAGIYSHFCSAETDPACCDEQVARLDGVVVAAKACLPPPSEWTFHIANTGATLRDRRFHRGMARVGLGLLGYGPEQITNAPTLIPPHRQVLPIVRWLSRVIHVQRHLAGATIGYGRTHRLRRNSLLGVVPVGYADGYPLGLSDRGIVGVLETDAPASPSVPWASPSGPETCPRPARVLGRVNMDQIVIDLTDVPGARIGSLVELFGDEPEAPWALPRMARAAESHPYELLCRLSPRLPRKYVTAESNVAR